MNSLSKIPSWARYALFLAILVALTLIGIYFLGLIFVLAMPLFLAVLIFVGKKKKGPRQDTLDSDL